MWQPLKVIISNKKFKKLSAHRFHHGYDGFKYLTFDYKSMPPSCALFINTCKLQCHTTTKE